MRNNLVGEKVREGRLLLNPPLTQAQLAVRLQLMDWKISRNGVAKIETGVRKVTDKEVVKLADVLGVPIQWLFSREQ
jgi:transcriptional regulator with XRE-family HTH domain